MADDKQMVVYRPLGEMEPERYPANASQELKDAIDGKPKEPPAIDKALVREIAMDVGKAAVHHLLTMYPAAFAAVPASAQLSLRNCIHNSIMGMVAVGTEADIKAALERRKLHRRTINRMRKMRGL